MQSSIISITKSLVSVAVLKTSVWVTALWQNGWRISDIPVRGSGNYASDEQKEIARLKRELRDAQDALDVLKKAISILGK